MVVVLEDRKRQMQRRETGQEHLEGRVRHWDTETQTQSDRETRAFPETINETEVPETKKARDTGTIVLHSYVFRQIVSSF